MKNLIPIFLIALVVMGCTAKNENAALRAELAALAEENELLAAGDIVMELTIEAYQAQLLEIDENLAAIDEKHGVVKGQIDSDAETVEEDIQLHMEHIHGTMTNTKHKVAKMQENIDELYQDEESDYEVILALEIELDQAAVEIIARDVVIEVLNDAVIEEEIIIDELSEAYVEQAVLSELLYGALNTAYVVVGTKKELKENGIIDSEGGFLGLGRVKSLAADADDDWFIPIPISETEEIDLACKKAKLLTTHPESSYSLTGDQTIESLVIKDPIAFWDKSDFLIIEIVKQ